MKTRLRAIFLALVTMLGIGLALPASATASTSPVEIWSTYGFSTTLLGSTTFQVTGNSGVDVAMSWRSGPTESVYVAVYRKTYYGLVREGYCYQTVPRYGQGWCHINAPASTSNHVLHFSKNYDGYYISGSVYWH